MASGVISSLFIKLGIKSDDLDRGLNKAEDSINGFAKNTASVFKNIATSFVGAFAIDKIIDNFTEGAESVRRMAVVTQMSAEALQTWGNAAKLAGADSKSVMNTVANLTNKIDSLRSMNPDMGFVKALNEAGINAYSAGNAFDFLTQIAGRMQGMSAPMRRRLASQLGLDAETLLMMEDGKNGLMAYIKQAKQYAIYTKEDMEISRKFKFGIESLKLGINSISMSLARVLLPVVQKFVDWFGKVSVFLRQHTQFIKIAFIMMAAVISKSLIAMGWAFITSPIGQFILLVGLLAAAIDDLLTYAQGGKSLFASFWESWLGKPEEAMAKINALKQSIMSLTQYLPLLATSAKIAIGAFATKKAIGEVVSLYDTIKKIPDKMEEIRDEWVSIGGLRGKIIDVFETMYIKGLYAIDALKNGWKAFSTGFMSLAASIKEAIVGIIAKFVAWTAATWAQVTAQVAAIATNPVTWIVAGIAALVALIVVIYKYRDAIFAFCKKCWEWFINFFDPLIEACKRVGEYIATFFKNLWAKIKDIMPDWLSKRLSPVETKIQTNKPIAPAYSPSINKSSVTTSTVGDTNTRIGEINIITQATDADGIASGITGGLKDQFGKLVFPSQSGVIQ